MKILLLGHAEHGKGETSKLIYNNFNLTSESSSEAACRIFIFDHLKDKYGYQTIGECFNDRRNKRKEWYDLIEWYNKDDRARLAKDILRDNSVYDGMRSDKEFQECKNQKLFDLILGVYDPRKPLESKDSFTIDMFKESDLIIPNSKGLDVLEERILKLPLKSNV